MHIAEAVEATRPVLFECPEFPDNPEWFYALGGTLFVVRFRGQRYVITANHNLKAHAGKDLLVQVAHGATVFVPLDRIGVPAGRMEWGHEDICVLRVAPDYIDPLFTASAFDLTEESVVRGRTSLRANGEIVVVGYPYSELHRISECGTVIWTHRVAKSAKYDGLFDQKLELLHWIVLQAADDLDSVGGFSGAPVYARLPDEPWGLAGFARTGGSKSKRLQVVDSAVVYRAVEKYHNFLSQTDSRVAG